jgi:hypothetical protein
LTRAEREKIQQIQNQLDRTTPGDWMVQGHEKGETSISYQQSIVSEESPNLIIESEYGMFIAETAHRGLPYTERHNIEQDTVFIANAKNNMQFLLNVINDLLNNKK